ncbi:MAG: DUF6503 family protein [Gemmatimonadota bacterium]|nr:DUF6503 family protein [Gemmatimonadota bacterium]
MRYTPTVPVSLLLPVLLVSACGGSGAAEGSSAAEVGDATAERTPARELLNRSIDFHDPGRLWGARGITMTWTGTDGEGEERVAMELHFFPDASRFAMDGRYAGSSIEYEAGRHSWSAIVDGESDLSADVIERMRLGREEGFFWRSYYAFLAGLPMKLLDPGTRLDSEVMQTTFDGRPVLAVRATYDPDVGGDTWYFYFDPASAELVGARFYHDESANDGEYLVFEGLIESEGLRLPKRRRWYVNADDRFLGADEIEALEVSP